MNFDRLKNCMDRLVDERHTPGVYCIVNQRHKEIFRYGAGMRDREARLPITGNELYLIFSMTKMLTCTAALRLLEKGAFRLDDPISVYLPEFDRMRLASDAAAGSGGDILCGGAAGECFTALAAGYAQNPITVRDLFTMRAGLNYDIGAPAIRRALAEGRDTTRELVSALAETHLAFEPGTRFRYSLCHDVLGALIEVVSGKSLGQYMQENIFGPLHMCDTFFGLPKDEARLSRMAALYEMREGSVRRLPLACPYILSPRYESGGAGLVSSAFDYSRFLAALASGGTGANGYRLLSPASVRLMSENQLSGQSAVDFEYMRRGYGYGLGVRTHIAPERSGSLSPVGEFGWDGAAGAFSMVDTENGLSLTYFQHMLGWSQDIQNEIRNALYASLA